MHPRILLQRQLHTATATAGQSRTARPNAHWHAPNPETTFQHVNASADSLFLWHKSSSL